MRVGVPRGDQGARKPRRPDAGVGPRARRPGPRRGRRARRGRGHRHPRRRVRRGRRQHRADADAVFAGAEMIVKVKEPQPAECARLRNGQILFTYLHLAPDPEQAKALIAQRRGLHRVRDGDVAARRPAAARADVRSRRAHGGAGGRLPAREAARRHRACCWAACPASRRARSSSWAAASSARTRR